MKFGVVVFPGSNCDHDAWYALGEVLHQPVEFLWHQSEQVNGFDAILLPGGFSYGDYLRTGAIARFSPVMRAVEKFARGGGLVLGICNGFQILCEAGLLPGVLQRNAGMRFVCRQVHVRVEATDRRTGETVLKSTEVEGKSDVFIGEDQQSAEEQALPLIADDIAKRITGLLVESWQ